MAGFCIDSMEKMRMKIVKVAAAIIIDQDKILATQRSYGDFKGLWEFPGGKIEAGETAEAALKREIREELDVGIEILELFDHLEYDYENFHLSLDCFIVRVTNGSITLKEHSAAKWLGKNDLNSVTWLPADITLIEKLQKYLV